MWDAASGAEILTVRGHAGQIDSASFSPDGSRILTGSVNGSAKVHEMTGGAELLRIEIVVPHLLPAYGAHPPSPYGKDIDLGDFVRGSVFASFSPDGLSILVKSDFHGPSKWVDPAFRLPAAKTWDANTGTALHALNGHSFFTTAAAFSPDGSLIVTGSVDRTS